MRWIFLTENDEEVASVGGRDKSPTVIIRGFSTYIKTKEITYFGGAKAHEVVYRRIDKCEHIDRKDGLVKRPYDD